MCSITFTKKYTLINKNGEIVGIWSECLLNAMKKGILNSQTLENVELSEDEWIECIDHYIYVFSPDYGTMTNETYINNCQKLKTIEYISSKYYNTWNYILEEIIQCDLKMSEHALIKGANNFEDTLRTLGERKQDSYSNLIMVKMMLNYIPAEDIILRELFQRRLDKEYSRTFPSLPEMEDFKRDPDHALCVVLL